MVAITLEQIRRRAYEIWESEGRPEGADIRHWRQACAELDGDNDHQMPLDEIDRDEAALLQGAGEIGDLDPDSGTSRPAKKKPSSKSAAREAEITTGEKPSGQKIKKTKGP